MTDIFDAKTPYHGPRKPMMIVIHGTEVGDADSRAILEGKIREASSHYYIDDKGEIVQYLDETVRAWHAGKSRWSGFSDVNSLSVGIELLALSKNGMFNGDDTVYTDAQIEALSELCKAITDRWNIQAFHILGHQDIDTGRIYDPAPVSDTMAHMTNEKAFLTKKYDPGSKFPWKKLADLGVGAWHGLEPAEDKIVTDENSIEKFKTNLTLYGYDTRPSPTGRIFSDVVTVFQTHFLPWNICGQVTNQSTQALEILLQKKFSV
jgi:N-acetyl-anhydromuramyl-L-alanine amidase AmpD